jgi:hypothetical protein
VKGSQSRFGRYEIHTRERKTAKNRAGNCKTQKNIENTVIDQQKRTTVRKTLTLKQQWQEWPRENDKWNVGRIFEAVKGKSLAFLQKVLSIGVFASVFRSFL